MAIIKTFLCCTNTRTGSTISGYYSLIVSVLSLSFYLYRYFGLNVLDEAVEYGAIIYAGFVVYTMMITASLMLIPGIYMDRRYLLLPWIYMVVLTVLYETSAVALLTMVHIEKDEVLQGWEIFSFAFYCFRLFAGNAEGIIHVNYLDNQKLSLVLDIFGYSTDRGLLSKRSVMFYCFACVVSQYQELSAGRGTYDYFHKPERRYTHRCHRNLFDIDTYELPFGVHLPPYSPDDPHKEYSPPPYICYRNSSVYRVVPEIHNQNELEMHNQQTSNNCPAHRVELCGRDTDQRFHSENNNYLSGHYVIYNDVAETNANPSSDERELEMSRMDSSQTNNNRTSRISLGIVWV